MAESCHLERDHKSADSGREIRISGLKFIRQLGAIATYDGMSKASKGNAHVGPVGTTKLQYEDIWRWALPELRPARRMQQDSLPVAS